jgi:hypothetical protein
MSVSSLVEREFPLHAFASVETFHANLGVFSTTHIAVAGPNYTIHVIARVQNVARPEELFCYIANLDIAADIAHVDTMCGLLRWILVVGA